MVEIQSGEGGDDAKAFTQELTDAYFRWLRGDGVELLASADGYASFLLPRARARRFRETEVGLHCIQRIPRSERRGRVHTSFARVTMSPLWRSPAPLDLREVELTQQRGHGNGGQGVNTTDSAVRARHRASGITVFINGRSRLANQEVALKVLAGRVAELHRRSAAHASETVKRAQITDGKIRTYNLTDNRAVDHRTGRKVWCADRVLRGEFDRLTAAG